LAEPGFKAASAATRLNPAFTAVGENLMGLSNQPFTGQVMRQQYPQLYQQPQMPAFATDPDFMRKLFQLYGGKLPGQE
jgi:hypothetical protein